MGPGKGGGGIVSIFRTRGDGRWFPADGGRLREAVESFIAAADDAAAGGEALAAGIAPHAGYAYSGGVAGYTYRALRESARHGNGPDLVVVLGFSHRVPFEGVAWLDADAIRSPLGEIAVDRPFMEAVRDRLPGVFLDVNLHDGEHSAENQLPFLQVAVPGVPVAVGLIGGHAAGLPESLAGALRTASAGRRLFVVASTDLLHDADYDRVKASDARTLQMMERLDSGGLNKAWSYETQVCCGIGPVLAVLETARMAGCRQGRRLCYCNSGDIDPSGRGQWVVGYGAMVFAHGNV
jgi:AmmeMemoRadiSam system protein B